MIARLTTASDFEYKNEFVAFIKGRGWHWFITIPIGSCDPDDILLKRVRRIANEFCRKYLVSRYHKLPDDARFTFVVAFEGERRCGNRHAHILAFVPMPTKRRMSQDLFVSSFPHQFRNWWARLRLADRKKGNEQATSTEWLKEYMTPNFRTADTARAVYTVKYARQHEVTWSRVEFANSPKAKRFKNRNLDVNHNRNKQRRAHLKALSDPLCTNHAV